MAKKLILRYTAFILALACALTTHAAGINKGFYKKAAQKVWAMDGEGLFDATKTIPDETAAGQSAVIIGRHDDFVGKRDEQNTMFTATGRTNRTQLTHTRRSMVKLLDESAVEYFSDFEFGGTRAKNSFSLRPVRSADCAFGARIYKPDGTVKDVDVNEALEVSDGKDGGKNKKFKLAVPGLEVGDVIEYFYYTEYENENGDIDKVDVVLADHYPVMSQLITGKFDPTLTIELKSYNGAPNCTIGKEGDKNSVRVLSEHMPAVNSQRFIFEERQLPFIRLNTINNHDVTGTYTQRAKNTRSAGIYQNINGAKIQTEAMENIVGLAYSMWKSTRPISGTPRKATKMVKDYAKAHPEATPRHLADVAWLAVLYQNFITKDNDDFYSSLPLSLFHNQVMENLDIYPRQQTGIAFANGRDEVSINDMSKWSQTTFMSLVADTLYHFNGDLQYAPGEVPALFQDVPAVRIIGRLREHTYAEGAQRFTIEDRKFSGNKSTFRDRVSIDADAPERIKINRQVSLEGAAKESAAGFTNVMEWIRAVEDFFAIPEGKRFKTSVFSADERQRALQEAISEECLNNLGVAPDTITNFVISERGILPGSATLTYSMDCEVADMVEDLGDGLSIHLGKLLGNNPRLPEHERNRILDALFISADTEMHILTLEVPQGYKVDETSLEAFNRRIVNPVGQFVVQAKDKGNGTVEVQCVNRLRVHSVSLDAWPMLRDILDAAAEFADASLVLTRE